METEPERFAPGARILVRDEEWLVRGARPTAHDGTMIKAVGVSELVRDTEATFFTALDHVSELRPEETQLVADGSPRFRRGRLFLEAVFRRTPLPRSERGLALADGFLLNPLTYQRRPAELALAGLRPRILLADVVGLGKTLEIGLILAELIRRGRGDRILVVTPQHVLEQFQHELWTRFAIPLVRLDSTGIQRIQQEIPAGRNPFTYFRRAVISVDTLKDAGQFGHHLDAIEWDAVVIDESHNLLNQGSQRNRLARRLAERTDALLLASATPHNGDPRQFAGLVRLLDPAAIARVADYRAEDIAHLYLRRTKISPEVRDQVRDDWAPRGPSQPLHCPATPGEEKVFTELASVWLPGAWTDQPLTSQDRLFAYTLVKAFLSSHAALASSAHARLKSARGAEEQALRRLATLAADLTDEDSSKLTRLVAELADIGVGRGARAVVFSERKATLDWLRKAVPPLLGLADEAVRVLHGSLPDTEQQDVVKEFGLAGSPVRLLLTGDIASEGVNLHRECHHLIHFDLPWSLIRIEQRNGRIDRYGQQQPPQFRALVLTSEVPGAVDDRTVAEKLLQREEAAHRSLGSVEAATGMVDPVKEEDRLTRDLLAGKSVDDTYQPPGGNDILTNLLAGNNDQPPAAGPEPAWVPKLFATTEEFVDHALREAYDERPEDVLGLRREEGLLSLLVPDDLRQRLSDLPRSYLAQQRDGDRLRVRGTFDRELANRKLDEARKTTSTGWPEIGFLSDIHPLVEWLVDKVLIRLGRQQAPVLTAPVAQPQFLVQGMIANRLGQPTVLEWMAVSGLPDRPQVVPMADTLAAAGVGPDMVNRGVDDGQLAAWQALVPAAVAAARAYVERAREHWAAAIAEPLRAHRERVTRFEQATLFDELSTARRKDARQAVAEQRDLADRIESTGEPMLRVLAVIAPERES